MDKIEYYITNNPRRPIEKIINNICYYYDIIDKEWIKYYNSRLEIKHIVKQSKADKIDLILYGIEDE